MKTSLKLSALPLAATVMAFGAPVQAAPAFDSRVISQYAETGVASAWEHGRHRNWADGHRHGDSRRYQNYNRNYQRSYYDEPLYANTRTWRGRDGRMYCRKRDGTTGLIVGGAVGALLGREIDKYGDRSLGTILGAAGGALLGKELAKGRSRCR